MMKHIVPLIVVVALAAASPFPAFGQLKEVTVAVDGLACPFCAYTLEKNLKQVGGVEGLVIDVKRGTATLTPQPGQPVDVARVPAAVTEAGFTPREIRVSAAGHIGGHTGGVVLVAIDGTTLFRLKPNDVLSSIAAEGGIMYDVLGVIVPPREGDDNAGLPFLALTRATAVRGEK